MLDHVAYVPMGRIYYYQENLGTPEWRGLSIEEMWVDVRSYQHGASDTVITFVNNEGLKIPVQLNEKNTKRLAIQLLMGVL